MLFCQSIDVVITNDTFYWLLLLKSPLSQSEALLDKSRSAPLECAIHVLIAFHYAPLFGCRGDIVKEIRQNSNEQLFKIWSTHWKIAVSGSKISAPSIVSNFCTC